MRLSGPDPAAEVQTLAELPVLLPVLEVVLDLLGGPGGARAEVGLEIGEGVAPHTFGEPAAVPEGLHAGVAAHVLPLALVVLLLALGGAGMVVPLALLTVLPLEHRRELYPLGLQLPAAVWADLFVE